MRLLILPPGRRHLSAMLCGATKGGSRRIMLVDTPAQIAQIDCPGISGFCTVDEEGQTNYFKKAGGT
ncbi:MAG: DUF5697 family protein [Oscillospiraceae bacterium]